MAVLCVKVRDARGTREARRLRKSGRIPAIIYGHGQDPISLTLDGEEFETLVRHGSKALLDLDIEGQKESAVIKEMQWDVFGREILHVDFSRVSKDERITVEVPITTRGTAPGVDEGGLLDLQLRSLEVECPAHDIQEKIEININNLHLDQSILIKDLELKEGVVVLADPEQTVVQLRKVLLEEEEESEEVAEATAEPELIRREKADEESEG